MARKKKRPPKPKDLRTRYTEAREELDPSMPPGTEARFVAAFEEMRQSHPWLAEHPRMAAPFLAVRVRQTTREAGFEIDPDNCEKWMEVIKMWIELFMSFGI